MVVRQVLVDLQHMVAVLVEDHHPQVQLQQLILVEAEAEAEPLVDLGTMVVLVVQVL